MVNSPRALAIIVLVELATKHRSLSAILTKHLAAQSLPVKDRQLCRAIVGTTLRHRQEIDAVISHFSNKPLNKLNHNALAALRIGCCQLLWLNKIPPSAAVNETIKGMGRQPKWLKGFVNGVLRAIARQSAQAEKIITTLAWPERSNHPLWLTDLLTEQFGLEITKNICAANNQQPTLTLRLNQRLTNQAAYTSLLEDKKIAWQPGFLPFSLLLPAYHGPIHHLPGYEQGLFHVQDIGAQLICELFSPFPAGNYLDACAGLGGKTILLDQLLPTTATITAIEPDRGRFQLLQENLRRSQSRPLKCHHCSLLALLSSSANQRWQAILLDAPCSGLGIMGRQPDIRWHRQYDDLLVAQEKQQKLLAQAARLLAPGGIIVYATCSLAAQENKLVIDHFLQTHQDFTIITPSAKTLAPFLTNEGFFQSVPGIGQDGFFACAIGNTVQSSP